MFLIVDKLNEGKVAVNQTKRVKKGLSEGKSPKSYTTKTKLSGFMATKSQACVNSNWEKLRR